MIEFFASSEQVEENQYNSQLLEYWEKVIMEAEVNCEVLLKRISTNHVADTIIKTMPAKLKALKHGLMELLLPGRLLQYYPIPNKVFLYSLGEQLKSIQGSIKEVSRQFHAS